MAASTQTSLVIALVTSLLIFSGCQTCRTWLAATPLRTILGGYITSLLFMTLLTVIGNIETLILGKGNQAGLFPEVLIALLGALGAAALVHRVCVTTCILFSGVALYYMNKISQKTHAIPVATPSVVKHKKK